jgi:hypothetical protein
MLGANFFSSSNIKTCWNIFYIDHIECKMGEGQEGQQFWTTTTTILEVGKNFKKLGKLLFAPLIFPSRTPMHLYTTLRLLEVVSPLVYSLHGSNDVDLSQLSFFI